jgi:hypothetical protein
VSSERVHSEITEVVHREVTEIKEVSWALTGRSGDLMVMNWGVSPTPVISL